MLLRMLAVLSGNDGEVNCSAKAEAVAGEYGSYDSKSGSDVTYGSGCVGSRVTGGG